MLLARRIEGPRFTLGGRQPRQQRMLRSFFFRKMCSAVQVLFEGQRLERGGVRMTDLRSKCQLRNRGGVVGSDGSHYAAECDASSEVVGLWRVLAESSIVDDKCGEAGHKGNGGHGRSTARRAKSAVRWWGMRYNEGGDLEMGEEMRLSWVS